MNQQCFDFMLEEISEVICMREEAQELLTLHMAKAIVEVCKKERKKTNDKFSE